MSLHRYKVWNGPMPTTAAQASVTTGTAIKTMLQIATPSTREIAVLAWGFSVDDPPGADSVIELLQTDVAATVTAHSASGIQPMDPGLPASLCVGGTSATGYTATVEGSTTATRTFDAFSMDSVAGNSVLSWSYQFTPDEMPIVGVSKFLRVRVTTPTTAVDMRCWVAYAE